MCPTTERDLADGIGDAGPRLALGSDSHAIIDLFEEARAVELNLRLKTERRGHFTAAALLRGATNHGCLGWDDAGRIEPGARADLVTLDLTSPRLETAEPDTMLESIVFAATAADVSRVIVGC
jgi:cytosine/adenosine deaminase-related metal-dependent hydrolase